MKKVVAGFCMLSFFLTSCIKKTPDYNFCNNVSPFSEDSTILAFCAKDSITAMKDSNNLYYQIIIPGIGVKPTINSTIFVTYTGSLLDGTVFDQRTTPVSFQLGTGIIGWQLGIPYIGKGGRIKLIVPSAYAYGCTGYLPVIPPNSILYFDVQVVDVQ